MGGWGNACALVHACGWVPVCACVRLVHVQMRVWWWHVRVSAVCAVCCMCVYVVCAVGLGGGEQVGGQVEASEV